MHNNHKMGSSDSLLKTIREIMEKKHTTPETPKEKSLAKLAHPKDKITHKDVLVGRGVLKKENSGDRMGVIVGTRKEKVELEPRLKEEADGGKHSTYTIKTSGDQKNIHKEMMKHVNPGYHHWIGQHSKKGPISDDDHKEIKRVANANDANVHVSSSTDEEGYHHVLIHSSTRESAKSTADDLYDEGGSVTRHRPKKSTRNEDVQHVFESTSSIERIHADLIKHVPVGHHYWMDIHHSKGPLSDKDHEDHKQTARSDEVQIKVSHHTDEEGHHHVLIHSPHKEDVKAAADHLYDDKSVMKKGKDDDAHYAKAVKEQVIERKLTGAETAKKEKLVLSLKKKMGGFKKRYGERAKEVMYATATKMAKEELNIDEASSEFKATGRKHPDGSITVRVERDGRTQVHTGKPAYVHKQIMDRYKIPSTSINMKEASDEQIGEMSGQYNESKTLGKYSFSGSLGKYAFSGGNPKSDSKSKPEKTYTFKGKVELPPKRSKQVAEVSTGMANRYLSKTQDDDTRKAGRALALKKKWGGKVGGTEAPKVPTKD